MKKAPLIIFVSILGIGTLIFVVTIFAMGGSKNSNGTASNTTTTPTSSVVLVSTPTPAPTTTDGSAMTPTTTASSTYKDGTYSANNSYTVMRNSETLKVTLTLSGDTVTDVSTVHNSPDPESDEWHSRFDSAYKTLVVGKKISDIQLSRVSGASETTTAFMDALKDIENAAKA